MDFTVETFESIYAEETPNPETLKFVFDKLLYPGKSADFPSEESASASPLAGQLFTFPFVKSVFIASNFLTITKTKELKSWNSVIPELKTFLRQYVEGGSPIIDEQEIAKRKADSSNIVLPDDGDLVQRIKHVLEKHVSPAVEMDGGAIQFISFENGVLSLNMEGACNHCPSSMITLKKGVERIMKKLIPEVKEVVGIDHQ